MNKRYCAQGVDKSYRFKWQANLAARRFKRQNEKRGSAIVLWKQKGGYSSLHIVKISWWRCSPANVRGYLTPCIRFEFLFIGFALWNKGWGFRLFNRELVWVG